MANINKKVNKKGNNIYQLIRLLFHVDIFVFPGNNFIKKCVFSIYKRELNAIQRQKKLFAIKNVEVI